MGLCEKLNSHMNYSTNPNSRRTKAHICSWKANILSWISQTVHNYVNSIIKMGQVFLGSYIFDSQCSFAWLLGEKKKNLLFSIILRKLLPCATSGAPPIFHSKLKSPHLRKR